MSLIPRLFSKPIQTTDPADDFREIVEYEQILIHEGIEIRTLAFALGLNGMRCTLVPGRGFVIHRIGQDPERPAKHG